MYKGYKEDKQLVKKILQYNKVDSQLFYKKNTGILSEITLGNIEKEKLKLKELDKGNK